MGPFSIAAAQIGSVRGDIEANVQRHSQCVLEAAEDDVDVIIFPELSLTGYEPELARDLILHVDDSRLAPLRRMALQHAITIVAGAPVASGGDRPYIGALVFSPEGPLTYFKQHLHPGEDEYFSSGEDGCDREVKEERLALAICADIAQASHAEAAARRGASIYAAGVLITPEGYETDAALLAGYARKYSLLAVMANHCKPTGGYDVAGKSAVWDEEGRLLAQAGELGTALVVAKKRDDSWQCNVVPMSA